jgi:RNA polymerase sigma-70 factor (ECF subfamily)
MGMSSIATIDDALVVRSQAGDPEAMSELATMVRPLVQRYASRFFSDPARAEDLTQTALMKAFSRVGDVRSPEAFPAWLLRITRNECLNELSRSRHVQITLSAFDEQGATLEAPPGGEDDPEEELVRGQLQDLVRRVAATLPPHYRQTLTMRALEDRSSEEISAALDVPVTVARLWYCRARKRFRRAFVDAMVARRGVPAACFEMGVPIAEMIEGTLGRSERDRVQEHLSDCAVCRQTEDELRNTAFRVPSRAFLLGLGMLKVAHTARRSVTTTLRQAHQAVGRLAVVGAGSATIAAAGTVPVIAGGGGQPAFAAGGAAPVTASAAQLHGAAAQPSRPVPDTVLHAPTISGAPAGLTSVVSGVVPAVSAGSLIADVVALLPGTVDSQLRSLTVALNGVAALSNGLAGVSSGVVVAAPAVPLSAANSAAPSTATAAASPTPSPTVKH